VFASAPTPTCCPLCRASRRSFPHGDRVPPGWLAVAHVVPGHPAVDVLGRQIPFNRARYDRFQKLLRRHGDSTAVAAKSDILRAVLPAPMGGGPAPASVQVRRSAPRTRYR
jgi:hypothetical protein